MLRTKKWENKTRDMCTCLLLHNPGVCLWTGIVQAGRLICSQPSHLPPSWISCHFPGFCWPFPVLVLCPVFYLSGNLSLASLWFPSLAWDLGWLFSKTDQLFTCPPAVYKSSDFSTFTPTLVTVCLFHYSQANGCEVVCHCGFYLHFLND